MWHIIDRFMIHFVASCFLTLAVFFALRYWLAHNSKVGLWLSGIDRHLLLTSALLVFCLMPLREPWDVHTGQTVTKAVFDQISWLLGAAVSVWGLYRFRSMR